MRFLHLADLHIGSVLQSGDARLLAKTKEAVWQHLEQLFTSTDQDGIDLVLLAGDIFEPSTLASADLERFIACLRLAKNAYILAVAGNHDPLTVSSPWQTVCQANLANFHLFDSKIESIYIPQLRTVVSGFSFASLYQVEPVLPEISNSQVFYRLEIEDLGDEKRFKLINVVQQLPPNEIASMQADNFCISLVHASPVHPAFAYRDDDYHYNPLKEEQIETSKTDYLALGHFHKPIISRYCPDFLTWQKTPSSVLYQVEYAWDSNNRLTAKSSQQAEIKHLPTYAGTLVAWPGNLIGRNFGETAYRGYFVGDWQTDAIAKTDTVSLNQVVATPFRLRWHCNNLRQFWQINCDIKDIRTRVNSLQTANVAEVLLNDLKQDPTAQLNFYRLNLHGELSPGEEVEDIALEATLRAQGLQIEVQSELTKAIDWQTLRQKDQLAALLLRIAEQNKSFQHANAEAQTASLQAAWQALQRD